MSFSAKKYDCSVGNFIGGRLINTTRNDVCNRINEKQLQRADFVRELISIGLNMLGLSNGVVLVMR